MKEKQKPRVTAAAIIERNGKILLALRNTEPFKGYWAIPGGHIDFGETAEQAVIREVKEETGLVIKPRFFNYFDEIFEGINFHAVVLVFSCGFTGKPKADGKEITDLKWFAHNEIKNLKTKKTHNGASFKLAFVHKKILEEWLKNKNVQNSAIHK